MTIFAGLLLKVWALGKMSNLKNPVYIAYKHGQTLRFITESRMLYDLESGELKFNYLYDLGETHKEWTMLTFEA